MAKNGFTGRRPYLRIRLITLESQIDRNDAKAAAAVLHCAMTENGQR